MFNSQKNLERLSSDRAFLRPQPAVSGEMVALSIFNPRFFWPSQCSPVFAAHSVVGGRSANQSHLTRPFKNLATN
jgi:hypothetical protein